jgi:hypothetical protein
MLSQQTYTSKFRLLLFPAPAAKNAGYAVFDLQLATAS